MSPTTIRAIVYTVVATAAASGLFGIVTAITGFDQTVEIVGSVAGFAQTLSPVVTAVIAVWGAAKWLEAQREKRRLEQLVPFILTDGTEFLLVCRVARGLFSPEGRANWVGTAVAPYAGTDGGKKRFADLPGLAAAQALIFPRILAGSIDVFVLKVSERELGFFRGGVADVEAASTSLESEYPALVAAYSAYRPDGNTPADRKPGSV